MISTDHAFRLPHLLYVLQKKFTYSEKATKFCEIFTLLLSYVSSASKSKEKISPNFVAFSEYMNFTWNYKWESNLWNVKSHDAILHGIFCSLLSFISIGGHQFLFWLKFPVINYERKMIRMLLTYLWFCWIRFPQAVTCLGLLYFIENYVSLTLSLQDDISLGLKSL